MNGPIKDGKQHIIHKGVKYPVVNVGYRDIQHKWSFVVLGAENPIYTGNRIVFLETPMRVTHTLRKEWEPRGPNEPDTMIFIEAWVDEESDADHELWKCYGCGGECELAYKGVDLFCPYGSMDENGELMKTDWRLEEKS